MKILFIASRKFDYAQDLAYSGLVQVLGPESVHDLPMNFNYHFNHKEYPKNLGVTSKNGLVSLIKHPIKQQIINAKTADVVIVGSAKPDAFQAYLKIAKEIPNTTPVVLIDGGDREELGGDLFRLEAGEYWDQACRIRPFDLIFKREYLKGQTYPNNVHPLPFAMNTLALGVGPNAVKDKDVIFWAMNSHPIREKAFQILKGKFDCDANGTGPSKSMKAYKFKGRRYHEEMAKAKIVISLRGGGWDTLRYWEAPALGTLLISTKLGIVIPNDFEDKKHIVHCKDDLSDLIELCDYYLKHDLEREQIAAAGREHLLKFHTNEARAKTILNVIKGFRG